ncbi:MAG TPA: hypothetical protein VMW91_11330 [Desulfosporosinus sp.]|nr:hypothetical protein [Desulfosporosinus sp.]
MINSTAKDQKEATKIEYPALMQFDKGDTFIVLFTEDRKGTVVYSKYLPYPIGRYSETWAMVRFTPFNGEVKLSNGLVIV